MLRLQPSIQTERLRLRPFVADDAAAVSSLAGAREIADGTMSVPHPYSLTAAKTWIAGLPHQFRNGMAVHFAVTLPESKELIGAVALREIDSDNGQAELGFWIGVPWWGNGYATEAARHVLRFGFGRISMHRIYAQHLARHQAAAKVLVKLGMQKEGLLRERVRKWGKFEDVVLYAILDREHESTLPRSDLT